jgi:H+/Cl- antiporter ClcA
MIDIYLYVCLIGVAGGISGCLSKRGAAGVRKRVEVRELIWHILIGVFAGWIIYEISEFFTDRFKVRLAVAGVAAFGGEDILLAIKNRLKKEIER